ncbi:hypothetical protein H6P81_011657 [Aristolochia fimbriata]|uniref:Uncharacterized protein n=1 Tax=Aristolochia fimbriata TaxID=158543 RepID=A0AAV7EA69_ARIFI|nr:hypothetical protein H6P81_011657 [Aristolochia fimbriata]
MRTNGAYTDCTMRLRTRPLNWNLKLSCVCDKLDRPHQKVPDDVGNNFTAGKLLGIHQCEGLYSRQNARICLVSLKESGKDSTYNTVYSFKLKSSDKTTEYFG